MIKNHIRFVVMTGLLLMAWAGTGSFVRAEALPFSADELARLTNGEVIVRHLEQEGPEGMSSRLVAVVLVRQPEEVIWEVLNHPEREAEWVPGLVKSAVVKDECPTETTRANTTDYLLSPLGIDVYYSTVREYDYQNRVIKSRLDPDRPRKFFIDIQAGWDFYPYQDGIIYQYWSDSKLAVDLPDFIAEPLGERALVAGVKAISARCDQVAAEMKQRPPVPVCPPTGESAPGR
jgi:hypothetical protein